MATTIRTTCSYCSVGCSLDYTLEPGKAPMVRPTTEYPVNLGKSCPKGFHLLAPFGAPDRALTPLIRENGSFREAGWEEAIGLFVERFRAVQHEAWEHVARSWAETIAQLRAGQRVATGGGRRTADSGDGASKSDAKPQNPRNATE